MKTELKLNIGDMFQITHCDGVVVNEVVSHISIEREVEKVNVRHHYKNTIATTYNKVTEYTFVVCQSGAVYEPHEISNSQKKADHEI